MTNSAKVDLSAAASAIAEMVDAGPQSEVSNLADVYTTTSAIAETVATGPQGEVSNLADVYTTKKPRLNPDAIGASLLDRMPAPTGWRILILPYRGKEKTSGGVLLPDEVQEKSQVSTQVGYVLKVGPLAYKDESKFPNGPWCQEKQWVMFARYAGSRFQIDGGEVRILNDDEVLATILEPEDIHNF